LLALLPLLALAPALLALLLALAPALRSTL